MGYWAPTQWWKKQHYTQLDILWAYWCNWYKNIFCCSADHVNHFVGESRPQTFTYMRTHLGCCGVKCAWVYIKCTCIFGCSLYHVCVRLCSVCESAFPQAHLFWGGRSSGSNSSLHDHQHIGINRTKIKARVNRLRVDFLLPFLREEWCISSDKSKCTIFALKILPQPSCALPHAYLYRTVGSGNKDEKALVVVVGVVVLVKAGARHRQTRRSPRSPNASRGHQWRLKFRMQSNVKHSPLHWHKFYMGTLSVGTGSRSDVRHYV